MWMCNIYIVWDIYIYARRHTVVPVRSNFPQHLSELRENNALFEFTANHAYPARCGNTMCDQRGRG